MLCLVLGKALALPSCFTSYCFLCVRWNKAKAAQSLARDGCVYRILSCRQAPSVPSTLRKRWETLNSTRQDVPRRTRLPRVCSFYVPPYFEPLADRLHQLTETIVDDDLASLFVLSFCSLFLWKFESYKTYLLVPNCPFSGTHVVCSFVFFILEGKGVAWHRAWDRYVSINDAVGECADLNAIKAIWCT